VLHLVSQHKFKAVIEGKQMDFIQKGQRCFMALICNNMAYINGSTPQAPESALASHAVLDRELWHHHLCHIGQGKLEQAIRNTLADGLKLNSDDPILVQCEPCIHSKQH
jgi:hypothetical protein